MAGRINHIRNKLSARLIGLPSFALELGLVVFFVTHLYVFLEWIFYVTKPSFLDLFSMLDKVKVLFLGAALATTICLLLFGVAYLVGAVLGLRRHPQAFLWLTSMVPAVIFGALLLLLVDNFTYTLFYFGIATSNGIERGLYAGLFLALVGWSDWQVLGAVAQIKARLNSNRRQWFVLIGAGAWLLLGLGLAMLLDGVYGKRDIAYIPDRVNLIYQPHILWITGDGLSAEHLSLYDYDRDTTPILRSIAENSLVADNVFSNAKNTVGSLVAMFTGKPPLQTRVLFTPDILRGQDAYQHLPGLLRAQGYYSIQYGFAYYVDAYTVNMLDGFDVVNGRSLNNSPLQAWLGRYLPEEMAYFGYEIGNRIADRIKHIFYLKDMPNPLETVLSEAPLTDDEMRINAFIESMASFEQPMFIHLHLLGTHGPKFQLQQQHYSLGKDPANQEEWDVDFYDDAILEFDANVGRIVDALQQQGLLENTILIIGSDHAIHSDQLQRIPLLMRFPGGEFVGRIDANVQGIDIAPTILDYLGLPQPGWMNGQSLLGGDILHRYIYGAGAGHVERSTEGRWQINPEWMLPPFYQIGVVSVVDCQRWYELNLLEMSLSSGEVAGHSAPCPVQELINTEQAFDLLLVYLQDHGFEVDSLENRSVESLTEGK
jgi:arylsulfatase A-like enzyme